MLTVRDSKRTSSTRLRPETFTRIGIPSLHLARPEPILSPFAPRLYDLMVPAVGGWHALGMVGAVPVAPPPCGSFRISTVYHHNMLGFTTRAIVAGSASGKVITRNWPSCSSTNFFQRYLGTCRYALPPFCMQKATVYSLDRNTAIGTALVVTCRRSYRRPV